MFMLRVPKHLDKPGFDEGIKIRDNLTCYSDLLIDIVKLIGDFFLLVEFRKINQRLA